MRFYIGFYSEWIYLYGEAGRNLIGKWIEKATKISGDRLQ